MTDRQIIDSMKCSIDRWIKAQSGERIQYNGKSYDPRYTFKSDTIIERLSISENEMKFLGFRELIPKDWKRAKDRERKRLERASLSPPPSSIRDKSGAISEREGKPWETLGISRRTYYYQKKAGKLSKVGDNE
jgi:hypothetical protein